MFAGYDIGELLAAARDCVAPAWRGKLRQMGGGHGDGAHMGRIQYGTMSGNDLNALRGAFGMSMDEFCCLVLGTEGKRSTNKRWIARMVHEPLLSAQLQERIRRSVREEVRRVKPASLMMMDTMALEGHPLEDIADDVEVDMDIVRVCLLPPLKVPA